jgi:oxalate decarboxylase/phosphoglucose isomerase-like protein (cupin superfamily)
MKDTGKFKIEPYVMKIEKPWGFELIFSDGTSKVTSKILHITRGRRSSLQYHEIKEEILTLLSGDGILELEDQNGQLQKFNMELRKSYIIAPNQIHRFSAGADDCEIMESSTPEEGNTVRLEDDYGRGTETDDDRKRDREKLN